MVRLVIAAGMTAVAGMRTGRFFLQRQPLELGGILPATKAESPVHIDPGRPDQKDDHQTNSGSPMSHCFHQEQK